MTFSNNDFILSRSPYYINYAATASSYDYCIINLSIWTGSVTASTVSASYSLTAYKAMSSDTNLYLDISDYIKGYLNPILDYSWIDETLDNYIRSFCKIFSQDQQAYLNVLARRKVCLQVLLHDFLTRSMKNLAGESCKSAYLKL